MLHLSVAIGSYDRIAPLADGSVRAEGIDLNVLQMLMPESAYRMLHYGEFDVSEMSLSWYVRTLFADHPPFVAIPVFPSRMFRHSCVYVHADSGIADPSDLAGRRIGMPEYQMTAAVWLKGIMNDRHGVPVDSPTYFTGGLEQPGRSESPMDLPGRIKVAPIGPSKTLSAMLETGEIDALYTAHAPSVYTNRSPRVRRLFPDPQRAELEYFRETGIFPIMHVVVIRKDVHDANPWVARSLIKAFDEAKAVAYKRLEETTALSYMLPWLPLQVEQARTDLGAEDYWPYGVAANRHVLETFLRYSHEQGLIPRRPDPEELFAPSTLTQFRI